MYGFKSRKADAGLPDTFGNRVTRAYIHTYINIVYAGARIRRVMSCAVTIHVPYLFYFNAKFIAPPPHRYPSRTRHLRVTSIVEYTRTDRERLFFLLDIRSINFSSVQTITTFLQTWFILRHVFRVVKPPYPIRHGFPFISFTKSHWPILCNTMNNTRKYE